MRRLSSLSALVQHRLRNMVKSLKMVLCITYLDFVFFLSVQASYMPIVFDNMIVDLFFHGLYSLALLPGRMSLVLVDFDA